MENLFSNNWNDYIKFLGELHWEQESVFNGVLNCLEIIGNNIDDGELV